MVERHALVSAFARAHFSSASAAGNVPNAIVFPAHCDWRVRRREECELVNGPQNGATTFDRINHGTNDSVT